MKRKLPGRCSGIGAYGQTLSLLSRDPCPAALPRTPRASPAPGTDRARGGPSPAPPPRRRQLQRWLRLKGTSRLLPPRPGGIWCKSASRTPGWGARGFGSACLRLQKTGGASPATHSLRRLLLSLRSPKVRGFWDPLLSARRRCRGAASQLHRELRASREPHHSAVPVAGPGGSARRAAESRGCQAGLEDPERGGCGLSFSGQPSYRGLGHPGATSQGQVRSRSLSQGLSSGRAHEPCRRTTAGLDPALWRRNEGSRPPPAAGGSAPRFTDAAL
ncbi:uncharacterized protein LOC110255392 [Sus scrofa]|uniref:uncharacterized protein LOC110255392 n=1 Tax=Sus scrofa TaxID=9823 RepID=UPI000A2B524C|nr:uncharacterized protein LOC110255392 [Sus scrofa]